MKEDSLREIQKEWHGSLKGYLIGFVTSILLTVASFYLVVSKALTGRVLVHTILSLALVQAATQLICFLHVGQESKPKWDMLTFYFMILVLLIVVVGSIWIMFDLNDRMMSGMTMDVPHD